MSSNFDTPLKKNYIDFTTALLMVTFYPFTNDNLQLRAVFVNVISDSPVLGV